MYTPRSDALLILRAAGTRSGALLCLPWERLAAAGSGQDFCRGLDVPATDDWRLAAEVEATG